MATTTAPERTDFEHHHHRYVVRAADLPRAIGLLGALGAVLIVGAVSVGAALEYAADEASPGSAPDTAAGPGTAASPEAFLAGPTGGSATTSTMPLPRIAAAPTPMRRPDASVNRHAVDATATASPTASPTASLAASLAGSPSSPGRSGAATAQTPCRGLDCPG